MSMEHESGEGREAERSDCPEKEKKNQNTQKTERHAGKDVRSRQKGRAAEQTEGAGRRGESRIYFIP